MVDITNDITLVDKPFYNVHENTEAVTINGNGKTVTQYVTSEDKFNWIGGTRTTMGNLFSSTNGSKITVNDLTFKGTTQTISFGKYVNSTYTNYNTEFNNVNVIDLNVVSFGPAYDGTTNPGISPAVSVYGNATLNNTNIYGTKLSSLDTSPQWPVYDLAVVNYSTATANNSKIGTIYTWTHASVILNNSEVDTIYTAATTSKGKGIVVGEGSSVGTIKAHYSKKIFITVEAGATVGTIDLSDVTDLSSCSINIGEGATVNTIITDSGEMTVAEWQEANK